MDNRAKYVTADELAECYDVSEGLRRKLWQVTSASEKNDTRNDIENYDPASWTEGAPNLLSKVWGKFTEPEQTEIDKALVAGP